MYVNETLLTLRLQINYFFSKKIVHKDGRLGPVVVVGGIAGLWAYKHLFGYLAKRDVEFYVVDFSWKGESIQSYIDDLHQFIVVNKITHFTLLGYSMGGLVVSGYLQKYDSKLIKKAITIGAPFGGSRLAAAFFWNKTYRDIVPKSAILQKLRDSEIPNGKLVCIYTPNDQYIGSKGAVLSGAKKIRVDVLGHNHLQIHERLEAIFDKYLE